MPDTRPDLDALREAQEAVDVLLDRIDYVNGADAREVVARVKTAMAALASPATGDSRLAEAESIIEAIALVVEGEERPLLDDLPGDLGDRIAAFIEHREVGDSRQSEGLDNALVLGLMREFPGLTFDKASEASARIIVDFIRPFAAAAPKEEPRG